MMMRKGSNWFEVGETQDLIPIRDSKLDCMAQVEMRAVGSTPIVDMSHRVTETIQIIFRNVEPPAVVVKRKSLLQRLLRR